MIKIACVIHSLGIGGMERVMSILINDFAHRSNVEVHLILIGRKRNIEFELDKRINIHKPNFEFNSKTRNWHTIKTLLFIRQIINKIQPVSILSFGEMWNNLVLLSLFMTRPPVYISDRSQPNKNLGIFHNFLRSWLYPRAAGLIVQTSIAEEVARKNKLNKNITIIGNPIKSLILPNTSKEKIVVTVGRLIPTKNIDQLIRIFSLINKPNWRLFIIGGNAKKMELISEYNKQVESLQMQGKIFLLGEQKNIIPYLAKSSIFAFTSSSEGFPNALAEAIAAQLPVIAYDCVAGPSDLIKNGKNGFLIEENNEKLFKENLERLMNSEELRNQFSNASKEILKKFEQKSITRRFFQTLMQSNENTY